MRNGLMQSDGKIKIYVWLALLLLGNILVGYLVVIRTTSDIKNLNQIISYERSALESRYVHRAKARNTLADLKSVRASLPEVESSLLHEGEELQFVTALEEAAAAHSIDQKIQISPREGKVTFGDKVPVNLVINGTWGNVLRYVRELEKMKIIFIFEGLTFTQGRREEDRVAGKINGSLGGHIYFAE